MNKPTFIADLARTGTRLSHTGLGAILLMALLFVSPVSAQERSETSGPRPEVIQEMMRQLLQDMMPQMMRQMMQEMMEQSGSAKASGDMMSPDAPVIPAVAGYSEGRKILFLHTEASDPDIAKLLSDMMGSLVLVVPSLVNMPIGDLGRVYVFTNGMPPDGPAGPLGFQPDVFENPPGSPDYTPLRTIVLVTWSEGATPRLLKSGAEVQQAFAAGDVTVEEPGVVVNMPMLTWPVGRR